MTNRDEHIISGILTLIARAVQFQEHLQLYVIVADYAINPICIKTHGSESWGQEEAGLRDEPVSYLQVTPL